VEDAKFKENPHWGNGGSLNVADRKSVGGGTVVKDANSSNAGAEYRTTMANAGSRPPNDASSPTNVHAIPPGQAGVARQSGTDYAELKYNNRTVPNPNDNNGTA
jgi:hypothetical protein